jgi:hypothetical protein
MCNETCAEPIHKKTRKYISLPFLSKKFGLFRVDSSKIRPDNHQLLYIFILAPFFSYAARFLAPFRH